MAESLRKAAKALLLLLIVAGTFVCSLMRLFQLLKYTDSETGLVSSDSQLSIMIYGVLLGLTVLSGVYALISYDGLYIEVRGSRLILYSSFSLAALFFVDFVHQCYNCFVYYDTTSRVEYNYFVPLILGAIACLICSFYMITIGLTANDSGVDFKSFNLFHFSLIIWAFIRLVMLMVDIVDVAQGVESICEFLLLVAIVCFEFTCISAIEKGSARLNRFFIFSSLCVFFFSIVLAFPRMTALLAGKREMLYDAGFTATLYFALGIFSLLVAVRSNGSFKKD